MTKRYYWRNTNCLDPDYRYFIFEKNLSESPENIQKYIRRLYKQTCEYENIIKEKNKIIESKHKEIKRLNLCLLKKSFSIKKLKGLLDPFCKYGPFNTQKAAGIHRTISKGVIL